MRETAGVINVGLTGGIGSGKSEVAYLLAAAGAYVIDADVLACQAVARGTPGLAQVVETFGPDVLRPDGSLDRARLGGIVFRDPDRLSALNAIVHPYVAARTAELVAAAPPDAVVVHDVPLLVENDLRTRYDVVVVVDVTPETQLRRLVESRGMSEEEAVARIRAQAAREERRAVADVIIDNEGDRASLAQQVRELWRTLVQQASPTTA